MGRVYEYEGKMTSAVYFDQKITGLSYEEARRAERPPIPTPGEVKTIHISAICGKAMAPLAGLLVAKGYTVTGSDFQYAPPMSDVIDELGIAQRDFSVENVAQADLVVIGNALGPDNVEAVAARELGKPYISIAEALSIFVMGEQERVVVAGTHGKTTTTGLLIKLFLDAGVDPSFLVGGVVQGENTAYATSAGQSFIIEGDEYDTAYFDKRPKFLHYGAKYLIVTSLELDHTDIYRDEEDYFQAFKYLVEQMPEDGIVLLCADNAAASLKPHCRAQVITYGFSEEADLRVIHEGREKHLQRLSFTQHGQALGSLQTPLTGEYNCANITCAVGIAIANGLPFKSLAKTISTFTGMKKRQELLANCAQKGIELIDDYAHHPTAVAATLAGMRNRYGSDHRILAIFEPRSNSSRRKSFENDYPASFQQADYALIKIPSFRHNDDPENFMDAERVREMISDLGVPARLFETNEQILAFLREEISPQDIMITMSNGHFDHIQDQIIEELELVRV